MKKLSKAIVLLLSAIMVLAMSTSVFAGTIEVQDVIDGETYTAYKILNYRDSGTGEERVVSYYLTSEQYTSIGSVLEAAGFSFTASSDGTEYFVNNADALKNSGVSEIAAYLGSNLSELGDALGKYTAEGADGSAVFTDMSPGYYFVTSTAGSLCALHEDSDIATVVEKNTVPTVDKKEKTSGNDYVDGKVMLMRDMGGKLDLEKWKDTIDRYKELTTDGVTEIEKVGEGLDEETGERKVISFKLFGFCSVSITSVNSESFDGQILSRGINVIPEATDQQVKMYHKYNNGLVKTKQSKIIEDEIGLLHDYIRYIMLVHAPHVKVFNPYWECLESWFHESEYYKRNLALYSSLVEAVTLLNYEFRRKQTASDGQEYVISSREDNELVSDLFNVSQGLTSNATHIFNLMVGWFRPADTLETNFNEEIEEEYFNYQHNNLNLKDCKYIFGVSNVRRKGSRIKKLRNLPYGDILNSLINNGLVQVVGKMNRGNNNIYALDHWEPIDETKIVFDEDCISEYVDSMCVPYGLDPTSLWKIVNGEKTDNDVEHSFKDLEFPPWVSPVTEKVRTGFAKGT